MRIALMIVAALAGLAASAGPAAGQDTRELVKFLPAAGEIAGWKPDGEPLVYTEDNLWEYIDGAADNFLAFEFRQVLAQDFVSSAGRELKVEIYEHESPLMAYGIYAQMRSPGLAHHDIGDGAFSDEYSINLRKGCFFVRVAVFETGDETERELEAFATAIAAKIPAGGVLPSEVSAFPEEGLVPNDTRYITQGVLGREKFPPAFVGAYRVSGAEAKLYLSTLSDSAAARDTFIWYTDELESFQATSEGPEGNYILGLGKDPYQGDIVAFTVGKWFGVLTGLKAPGELGVELVRRTVERLEALEAARRKAPPVK
jgi:hypothetical protein